MVEVFRTNVNGPVQARQLLEQIRSLHPGYDANFDLGDCDRILRVECRDGTVHAPALISLLQANGCTAEVL